MVSLIGRTFDMIAYASILENALLVSFDATLYHITCLTGTRLFHGKVKTGYGVYTCTVEW